MEVELIVTLLKGHSKPQVTQSSVKQKFDGAAAEAVNAALDQALDNVLSEIEN